MTKQEKNAILTSISKPQKRVIKEWMRIHFSNYFRQFDFDNLLAQSVDYAKPLTPTIPKISEDELMTLLKRMFREAQDD